MYAVRARSVVESDAFFDQTEHACGGLYSSVHPPLQIWLTAGAMALFGENEYAARFFSALAGAATVVLLFFFFDDRRAGFFAAVFLGLAPLYWYFSRQGQLDVFFTFWIALSIFFLKNYLQYGKTGSIAAAGATFGLSLMSKALVGGIFGAAAILTIIILKRENRVKSLLIFGAAAAIAAPWHIYMSVAHGGEFFEYMFGYHVFERAVSGVEDSAKRLGALFYVNQLPVAASAPIVLAIYKLKDLRRDSTTALLFAVFIAFFVVFSASASKLHSYAIPMLIPIAALAGAGASELLRRRETPLLISLSMIVVGVWSYSLEIRIAAKDAIKGDYAEAVLYLSIAIIISLVAIIFRKKINGKIILGAALVFLLSRLLFQPQVAYYHTNMTEAAALYEKSAPRRFVFIESENPSGAINPQLDWYFNEITRRENFIYFNLISGEREIPDGPAYVVVKTRLAGAGADSIVKRLNSISVKRLRDSAYYYFLVP